MAKQPACDVFICHAGEQKYEFAWSLHDKLCEQCPGAKIFLDQITLEGGGDPTAAMAEGVESTAVAVCILSRDFIKKKHPMKELLAFLERAREAGPDKLVIIPVLYHIDYDTVCNASERVYNNNDEQWPHGRPEAETLVGWSKELATMFGKHTAIKKEQVISGNMPDCIQKVAECVKQPLIRMKRWTEAPQAEPPKKVVGLDNCADVVRDKLLEETSNCVLLHGMAGIGKTVLAKMMYLELRDKFEITHFVYPPAGDTGNGVKAGVIQQQGDLLSRVRVIETPSDMEHGRELLKKYMHQRKVLLVVDGVHTTSVGNLLDLLLPKDIMEVLAPGSKLLVTSRDKDAACDIVPPAYCHPMKLLNDADAEELFRYYAGQCKGVPDTRVKAVVMSCGGLPMFLQAAGKYFSASTGLVAWKKWTEDVGEVISDARYHVSSGEVSITIFDAVQQSFGTLKTTDDTNLLYDVAVMLKGSQKDALEAYCSSRLRVDKLVTNSILLLEESTASVTVHPAILESLWVWTKCGTCLPSDLALSAADCSNIAIKIKRSRAKLQEADYAVGIHVQCSSLEDLAGKGNPCEDVTTDEANLQWLSVSCSQENGKALQGLLVRCSEQKDRSPTAHAHFDAGQLKADDIPQHTPVNSNLTQLTQRVCARLYQWVMHPEQTPINLLGGIRVLSLSGLDFKTLNLEGLNEAGAVYITSMVHLISISITSLQNLGTLEVRDCGSLTTIKLSGCGGLQHLTLAQCAQLQNLEGLADLGGLTKLVINGCTSLCNKISSIHDAVIELCPEPEVVVDGQAFGGFQTGGQSSVTTVVMGRTVAEATAGICMLSMVQAA